MDIQTVSYRKLPTVLTTPEQLYQLIVAVAQIFRSAAYANRLATLGVSYLDLAHDYYLQYLEGGAEPARRPFRNGKPTNRAVELCIPIAKGVAYYIVQRDILSRILSKTPEERAGIVLISLEQLIEQENERHSHEGI